MAFDFTDYNAKKGGDINQSPNDTMDDSFTRSMNSAWHSAGGSGDSYGNYMNKNGASKLWGNATWETPAQRQTQGGMYSTGYKAGKAVRGIGGFVAGGIKGAAGMFGNIGKAWENMKKNKTIAEKDEQMANPQSREDVRQSMINSTGMNMPELSDSTAGQSEVARLKNEARVKGMADEYAEKQRYKGWEGGKWNQEENDKRLAQMAVDQGTESQQARNILYGPEKKDPNFTITGIQTPEQEKAELNKLDPTKNLTPSILGQAMENEKKKDFGITMTPQDADPDLIADQEDQIYRKSLVSKNGYLVDPNTGEIVEEDDGSNLPLQGSNRQQATKDFQTPPKPNYPIGQSDEKRPPADTTSWTDSHDPNMQAEADRQRRIELRKNSMVTDEDPNLPTDSLVNPAADISQGKIGTDEYTRQVNQRLEDSNFNPESIPDSIIQRITQIETGGASADSLQAAYDREGAVGPMQQRQIFRDEIARLDPSMEGYDPKDPVQAGKAAKIYIAHQMKTGLTFDQAIMSYNAGRSGAKKGAGKDYLNKFKATGNSAHVSGSPVFQAYNNMKTEDWSKTSKGYK